jgi:phosphatidylserine/phosphatidylglycerophosphate/cardiolipin synthase-like enzyme
VCPIHESVTKNQKTMKTLVSLIPAFFLMIAVTGQTSIYEIQGQASSSPLDGQKVTTYGIITAVVYGGYFVQDSAKGWNGVFVYDDTQSPVVGDSVSITAKVDEYSSGGVNVTELKDVTNLTVHSSGHDLPEPVIVTTHEANDEQYEGVLIRVEGVVCTDTDLGYGEWEVDDGSGPLVVDDLGIAFSPVLELTYNITAPLHETYGNYKLEPRDENDIEIGDPVYFTLFPLQKNITTSSFTLEWYTNDTSTTEVLYGKTTGLELGLMKDGQNVTKHQIDFTGLDPNTIYYVKPYSVLGNDTTKTQTFMYSTASNSTGKIKVYFNHVVDTSVATTEYAVYTDSIADTIISYINRAQHTLDVMIYDIESFRLADAINAAYDRGVDVRVISDDPDADDGYPENIPLDSLNPAINVLKGNADAIMHDKFLIIDAGTVDSSWVVTGSINWTHINLGWDFNNMICLQDQVLANAYTLEFNEMWGDVGLVPNPGMARFGSDKTDNTPHFFNVGGVPVESYFSPSDKTTLKIIHAFDSAHHNIEFAVMVFTEDNIANAIAAAKDRGAGTKGIIDYAEYDETLFNNLINDGVSVIDYKNEDGTSWPDGPVFHHKYAIVDFDNPESDPVVITGSHNWSLSANAINDENTLIIHDATIANLYHQEFFQRFREQMTPIAYRDLSMITNDSVLNYNVLANDYLHGQMFSAALSVDGHPANGTALVAGGNIEYTPNPGFTGLDTIHYQACNGIYANFCDMGELIVQVSQGSGIEKESADDFKVYPNPVKDQLNISFFSTQKQPVSISIINMQGRTVLKRSMTSENGVNNQNINDLSFSSGVYSIQLSFTDQTMEKRLIIVE